MKKTLYAYMGTMAFIFLCYLVLAFAFALLYQHAKLEPSFYSMAVLVTSYTVILFAGVGFGWFCPQKKLIHGILFILLFSLFTGILTIHHLDIMAIAKKDLLFLLGVIAMVFLKKEA